MDQSKVITIPAGYFDSIQEIVWNSYCRHIQELASGIDCLSQHVSFWELVQRIRSFVSMIFGQDSQIRLIYR